jgi:hypothetical protein
MKPNQACVVRAHMRVINEWASKHLLGVGISAAMIGVVALWLLLDAYLSPKGFQQRVEAIKAASSLATFLAVVIGGVWAYVKFVRRREHAPRVDFTVEVGFVGEQREHWLVDIQAFVNNEGLVRHTFRVFDFELRCLYDEDAVLDGGDEIGGQTLIPHLLRHGSWLPEGWGESFIEPGLRTRYSYVASVPRRASFVLLHGELEYGDGRVTHTAERLLQVPTRPSPDGAGH